MSNRQMLRLFLEFLQRDQLFLRSMLSTPMTDTLRKLINSQLKECVSIENDAISIGTTRGWLVYNQQTNIQLQGILLRIYRIFQPKTDYQISSALILHHTRSTIRLLHYKNMLKEPDHRLSNLTQCYLDCLASSCILLQRFL